MKTWKNALSNLSFNTRNDWVCQLYSSYLALWVLVTCCYSCCSNSPELKLIYLQSFGRKYAWNERLPTQRLFCCLGHSQNLRTCWLAFFQSHQVFNVWLCTEQQKTLPAVLGRLSLYQNWLARLACLQMYSSVLPNRGGCRWEYWLSFTSRVRVKIVSTFGGCELYRGTLSLNRSLWCQQFSECFIPYFLNKCLEKLPSCLNWHLKT